LEFRFRDRSFASDSSRVVARCLLFAALSLATFRVALAAGEGFYGPLELHDRELQLMKNAAALEDLFRQRGYRYENRELESLVARTGAKLAPKPTDDYIHYRFFITRDCDANAFTLPDGQVYITTGLLALLDNEAQLAATLAHEVQHAAGHHGIVSYRSQRHKVIGGFILGPLTLGVGDYFLENSIMGYSRDLEEEADRRGARAALLAGYDPRQIPRLFQILMDDPEGEQPRIKAKWSDHPALEARIAYTKEMVPGLLVGADTANLTANASGYRRLVRRATLDTVEDFIAADYPRSALRVARRLVAEDPADPVCHLALADARRALGPRADVAGEQNLTNKEKKRNLAARIVLTRDERQERLLDTPEGRQTLKINLEAARKSYDKVLELDPGMAEAHRGLGYLNRALGRPIDAGTEFVAYLKARPDAADKAVIQAELRQITNEIRKGETKE